MLTKFLILQESCATQINFPGHKPVKFQQTPRFFLIFLDPQKIICTQTPSWRRSCVHVWWFTPINRANICCSGMLFMNFNYYLFILLTLVVGASEASIPIPLIEGRKKRSRQMQTRKNYSDVTRHTSYKEIIKIFYWKANVIRKIEYIHRKTHT